MAEESITPAARFYRLHRDEQLARKKEEYNNRPDVIAKREERRRKLAEKRRRCAYACLPLTPVPTRLERLKIIFSSYSNHGRDE